MRDTSNNSSFAKKKKVAKKRTAKKAVAAKPAKTPPPATSKSDQGLDAGLIRDALDAAQAELESKPRAKAPVTERDKLIRQALAIQRAQSGLLDELDPNLKRRMQRLAVEMMERPRRKPDA